MELEILRHVHASVDLHEGASVRCCLHRRDTACLVPAREKGPAPTADQESGPKAEPHLLAGEDQDRFSQSNVGAGFIRMTSLL